jgi:hypothetical protein
VAIRHVVLASKDDGTRQALTHTDPYDERVAVEIRLVLKPSHYVAVHVIDEQGKPVAGAFVAALTWVTLPLTSGETDASGVARLRLPADAKIDHVIGAKAGAGFDYFENYQSRGNRERPPLPAGITLVLNSSRTVQVHATDSADRPVAGVVMVPWTIKKKGKVADANLSGCGALPPFARCTDPHGTVTFDWLPSNLAGGVNFLAVSDDYHQPNNPYLEPAQKDTRLTTRLLRNVPASGKVTKPDGRPAAGILLQAEGIGATNMYFRGYARTAADGSFKFSLYPDQTYIVAVIEQDWGAPSHAGIHVKEGEPLKDLDFRLGKGTLLEGRASVGADHKPIVKTGIDVSEQCPGPKARLARGTQTDADGRYRIRLGPGTYQLSGPDWEPQELVVRDEPRIVRDFVLARLPTGPLSW